METIILFRVLGMVLLTCADEEKKLLKTDFKTHSISAEDLLPKNIYQAMKTMQNSANSEAVLTTPTDFSTLDQLKSLNGSGDEKGGKSVVWSNNSDTDIRNQTHMKTWNKKEDDKENKTLERYKNYIYDIKHITEFTKITNVRYNDNRIAELYVNKTGSAIKVGTPSVTLYANETGRVKTSKTGSTLGNATSTTGVSATQTKDSQMPMASTTQTRNLSLQQERSTEMPADSIDNEEIWKYKADNSTPPIVNSSPQEPTKSYGINKVRVRGSPMPDKADIQRKITVTVFEPETQHTRDDRSAHAVSGYSTLREGSVDSTATIPVKDNQKEIVDKPLPTTTVPDVSTVSQRKRSTKFTGKRRINRVLTNTRYPKKSNPSRMIREDEPMNHMNIVAYKSKPSVNKTNPKISPAMIDPTKIKLIRGSPGPKGERGSKGEKGEKGDPGSGGAGAQVAVSAVLTTHFGPSKDVIIPFDLKLIDLGDNYDPETGVFICTVPGIYSISVNLMSHPGSKLNGRIYVNNNPVAALWADDSKNAGFYPSSSIQTISHLDFGDQVYIMLVDGGYGESWIHANYNAFTIYLLYEDMFV